MVSNAKDWESRRSPERDQIIHRDDDRSQFDRDRARILHSAAFRRLQAKTQVLGISEGDFRRTRLTHSIEVAQIATGIGERLKKRDAECLGEWLPARELLEAICFAHDLGHPPFGHGGERALNNALLTSPDRGENPIGFEGNGQTLRLLTLLEAHTPTYGLDLTRRTLLGVLKYPVSFSAVAKTAPVDANPLFLVKWSDWKPPKCYLDLEELWVKWILEPLTKEDRQLFGEHSQPEGDKHGKPVYKSLDCSIMDVADEIAYGVHDFEDGVALRLIARTDWDQQVKPQYNPDWVNQVGLPSSDELADMLFADGTDASALRKRAIGSLVNALISSVRLCQNDKFECPLLKFNVGFEAPAKKLQSALQDVISERIIKSQSVQTLEYRGQVNLLALFRAIETNPMNLLGGSFRSRAEHASDSDRLRVIADYIAGMTDEYATRMFERMFVPRHGTVFDRL